jgi:hypothetical protein
MEHFDPASFTVAQLFQPAVMALAAAFILAACVALYTRLSSDTESPGKAFAATLKLYAGVGLPISLIGYATGLLTGISRSPAVGNLLPAVLALIGGVSVYAFGSENKYRFIVGYCVCLLIVTMFYGTQRGAFEREFYREARLKAAFEMERRLRNYRVNRDLPEKVSDWLSLSDSAGK